MTFLHAPVRVYPADQAQQPLDVLTIGPLLRRQDTTIRGVALVIAQVLVCSTALAGSPPQ